MPWLTLINWDSLHGMRPSYLQGKWISLSPLLGQAHLHPFTLSICPRLGIFLVHWGWATMQEGVSEWLWMI